MGVSAEEHDEEDEELAVAVAVGGTPLLVERAMLPLAAAAAATAAAAAIAALTVADELLAAFELDEEELEDEEEDDDEEDDDEDEEFELALWVVGCWWPPKWALKWELAIEKWLRWWGMALLLVVKWCMPATPLLEVERGLGFGLAPGTVPAADVAADWNDEKSIVLNIEFLVLFSFCCCCCCCCGFSKILFIFCNRR